MEFYIRIKIIRPENNLKEKIIIDLPRHTISIKDEGFTPEQALNNTAEDTRDLVLKLKNQLKDIHEKQRLSQIYTFGELPEN